MTENLINENYSIQIDSRRFKLLTAIDSDVCKVMIEALDMWLEIRVLNCPITKIFCENAQGQCNECPVSTRAMRAI